MVAMEAIYADYERMGIPIYSWPAGGVRAATLEMDGCYAVFADFFRFDSIAQQKRMLMHEMGHCATGCTHKLSSSFDIIERHEFKADKYAALRYLPPAAFEEAFKAACRQPWELAEWFGLPQEFISWAMEYYRCNGLLPSAQPESGENDEAQKQTEPMNQ